MIDVRNFGPAGDFEFFVRLNAATYNCVYIVDMRRGRCMHNHVQAAPFFPLLQPHNYIVWLDYWNKYWNCATICATNCEKGGATIYLLLVPMTHDTLVPAIA